MIVLERKTPESLLFYEVMKRRAIEPKEYEQLYATTWAGYFGERRLDREWKDAGINGLFFHDFTCFNLAGYKHQIDTIFVCKHFVLVVEAKNVAGRIELNSQTRQLIRYYDANSKEGEPFNSPVDQVKRHQQLLENHFLTLSDYVPVEAAVVITNRNCLIGNTGNEVPVFTVSGLRSVLTEMTRRHQHVSLNMKQIRTSLEKLYRPHTTQPWRKIKEIHYGVLCLTCNGKMIPTKNGFKCLQCHCLDKNHLAVRRTLYDYRVLYGNEISNSQFRKFAAISSPDTAYKILSRLLSERKGANRGTVYIIPSTIYQPTIK